MDAATMERRNQAQREYEERYDERLLLNRPRPTHEMPDLKRLAEQAKDDPSAALEFSVACTPQTFLLAVAAERWDKANPYYLCIHCHDGKDLPHSGYVCQVCGS